MNMLLRSRLYTFDDFCAIVKDGQKADLIDGVIYMASPDNLYANLLNGWLCCLLTAFVQRSEQGFIFVSRVAYRLDDHRSPEPDISFVKKSRRRKLKRGYVAGAPDLAMEIVSPDSIERDYEKKREMYERAGVLEYWIVDEIEQKLTVLRLGKNGRYKSVLPKGGVFCSKVIKGFWLREEWLWTNPLPKALETLNLILDDSDGK